MTMMVALKFIGVFCSMLFTDICWVLATRRIKDGSALRAGSWGALLMLFAGLTTTSYVHNAWLILPTCLGSFVGTAIGVWLDTPRRKT